MVPDLSIRCRGLHTENVDAEEVYQLVHDASLQAVTEISPYRLANLDSSSEWIDAVQRRLAPFLVVATLRGAVAGLRQHGRTTADVLDYTHDSPDPTHGFDAKHLARTWLAETLMVEHALPKSLYDSIHASKLSGWATDATKAAELVLAIVNVATATARTHR